MPGTWTPLAFQPSFNAGTMLLLTDGAVMCQDNGTPQWWRLTPDASGSYINGNWSQLASGPNSPLYFASAVLKDGRVFVAGGEYNGGSQAVDLLAAEIYDPMSDTWMDIGTPDGWTQIGDAPSCVLPDGRVLLGSIADNRTAIYDPATGKWSAAGNYGQKSDSSSEETFTLLPDGSVLTVECSNGLNAEKYLIDSDKWVSAGATPTMLPQACASEVAEIGPALLLPDGRVFAIGASGNTALYQPPAKAEDPGTWASGPTIQGSEGILFPMDAPACLLPNGKVLLCASPGPPCCYPSPTILFEYDPQAAPASALTRIPSPSNAGRSCFNARMLLLPTGRVLLVNASSDVEVYTPDGAPQETWRPQIKKAPASVKANQTYVLEGLQLNGISQAVSYGDDVQMATNYPLVCIRNLNSGQVTYCRTFDHSTMAVATGSAVHSTFFRVPVGTPTGDCELFVVANGISSAAFKTVVGS